MKDPFSGFKKQGAGATPESLMQRAVQFHQAGRLPEAIKLYRQVLAARPGAVQAMTYLGAALLDRRQILEAIRMLEAAVKAAPGNVEALSFLGNARQMSGQYEAAEAAYRQALAAAPEAAMVHNNLGAVLQRQGRHEAAAESFRAALARQPGYAQAESNLSQALLKLGDTGAAIEAAKRAVGIEPRALDAQLNLGAALGAAGSHVEAVAAYEAALALAPKHVPTLTNLALALILTGQPARAVDICDRALAIDPGSVPALASKGVALSESGQSAAQAELVDIGSFVTEQRLTAGEGFADLASFNAALVEHICAHPTLTYEREGNATRLGRHTGDLLTDPKGPFAAFETLINQAIDGYRADLPALDHPVVKTAPKTWRLDMWSVVLEGPGHQAPHIHESGWLSGVYYPKVPASMGDDPADPAGWIEFGEPQTIYQARQPAPVKLMRPREGMLILFPSFMFHRTVPTGSEEMRVSIAFDVVRTG